MWIMIVMSDWFGEIRQSTVSAVPVQMISVEFSSRERCIKAVQFVKQKPKVYDAFCIQK